MLPHAHFQHQLPELPTISFLHLDFPYTQTVPSRGKAGASSGRLHRSAGLQRPYAEHTALQEHTGQAGKEHGA